MYRNNGLPTIKPNKTEINPQEAAHRERNKAYIDNKRSTKHKEFQEGERVLVRRSKTKSKMDSYYEQNPYTITDNFKNSVKVKDIKGKVHIRSKVHVQHYFEKPHHN